MFKLLEKTTMSKNRSQNFCQGLFLRGTVNHHFHSPTISSNTGFLFAHEHLHICRRLYVTTQSKRNFYDVLGVPHSATQEEIKKAFFALSKKYHPDVAGSSNKAAEAKFIEVKEAYDTLRDEHRRREYDQTRSGSGPSYQQPSGSAANDPRWWHQQQHAQHAYEQWYREQMFRENRFGGGPGRRSHRFSSFDFERIMRDMNLRGASNDELRRAMREIFAEFDRKNRKAMHDQERQRYEKWSEANGVNSVDMWKMLQNMFVLWLIIYFIFLLFGGGGGRLGRHGDRDPVDEYIEGYLRKRE